MSTSREKVLQLEICEYLANHGWLWTAPANLLAARDGAGSLESTDSKNYDQELALFPGDIFSYLSTTQPEEWLKLFPKALAPEAKAKIERTLLKKIAERLNKPYSQGGGIINAMSQSFNFTYGGVSVKFKLAQFAPENNANPKLTKLYEGNLLRVIHELQYSEHKDDRIDLVFFLNGIPILTSELKNGVTETYQNAVTQYKEHRTPWAEDMHRKKLTGRTEPLLNGSRAVAHFAVDPENIYMTTKLNGAFTHFLPFNAGGDETNSALNKENGSKPRTAYFWEDILHTHTVLNILRSFVMQTTKDNTNPRSKKKSVEEIIFPRYHQWFGTTLALATTLREDVGHSSLMMWSAGSGKSNGIAWLAHALNGLHYDSIPYAFDNLSPRMQEEVKRFVPKKLHRKTEGKIFTGGGFVITDRTNLDSQIGDTVRVKTSAEGTVVQIGVGGGADAKSKTKHLAAALQKAGSSIKIITLQTFPFAFEAIALEQAKNDALHVARAKRQTFFAIRDEAHVAEGGKNTNALLELLNAPESTFLTPEEKAEFRNKLNSGDADEVELINYLTDRQMISAQKAKADRSKISFFAYTATPKKETLQMFGRPDPDANVDKLPVEALATDDLIPLHTYSMDQAVKEGFILDVMRNYTTYDLSFQLAATTDAAARQVEASSGKKTLLEWVQRQPETLGQKAEIIVEHFKSTVFPSLPDERAQAMVFTASRADALLYKKALDAEIKARGYKIRTLVAFSGEVIDPDTNETVTERTANGVNGRNIAAVFEKDDYHILIVANKYQTGYDNIRLVGGYIDKKLKGMEAVQAFSRFNRIAPQLGKSEVYLVDFANEAEDIMGAFNQYYSTLSLEKKLDPNSLHSIQAQIEAYALYELEELEAWARYWLVNDKSGCTAIMVNVRGRYNTYKEQAENNENVTAQKYYAAYLPLLKQYIQVYGFQSTVVDYEDSLIEKQALFYAELYTTLSTTTAGGTPIVELDGVSIIETSFRKKENKDLIYEPIESITTEDLKQIAGATPETPEMVRMQTLINYVNDLFGNIPGVAQSDLKSFQAHMLNKMIEDRNFASKARSNSVDKLTASGQTERLFDEVMMEAFDAYNLMISHIHKENIKDELRKRIIPVAWDAINTSFNK